jgi:hypothetical protein
MIGQNYVGAIADEQISVNLHSRSPQSGNFLKKSERVKHNSVADHPSAARAQHSRRHKLENKLLAVNDDSVTGVMTTRVTGHKRKALRKDVYNLAFTFIAPLRADYNRSPASAQS